MSNYSPSQAEEEQKEKSDSKTSKRSKLQSAKKTNPEEKSRR